MKTIVFILLAFGLIFAATVKAPARNAPATTSQMLAGAGGQVGSSISSDGTAPNDNAMLDVQSPATGDGKGMLIPRVTLAQRTTASSAQAGGLLDNSGNLRGGAAQGLIVYQTNGVQGLYFNTSQTATPAWVHLGEGDDLDMQGHIITNAVYYGDGHGITNLSASAFTETDPRWASASNAIVADIATRLVSNVWAAAGSTTNYLPRTGGTMSGTLNMGAQMVTNVSHIGFNGTDASVGRSANGYSYGVAAGCLAKGTNCGIAMGYDANGSESGAALGYLANGYGDGAAVGRGAIGSVNGAAVGRSANASSYGASMGQSANGYYYGAVVGLMAVGTNYGVAMGDSANGSDYGVAMGSSATGNLYGAAVGYQANGISSGAAVGYMANGYSQGAAIGRESNGRTTGAAVGESANGYSGGAAVGKSANGSSEGAVVGLSANGYYRGVAMGREANGSDYGVAVGYLAFGTNYGVAVGNEANSSDHGVAVGPWANGTFYGTAVGRYANSYAFGVAIGGTANGSDYGVTVGYYAEGNDDGTAIGSSAKGATNGVAVGMSANGSDYGVAMGYVAKGYSYGAAMGAYANGIKTNVAIGARANAQGGTQQIAIGNEVTNGLPNTARIRGHLYLDGGTGIWYRANFGSSDPWTAKAFTIDHPLDPENKILRHFCLEGPQVWNVYAGNAQLVNGQAVVELPDYYSALNLVGSEIYSLTPIGEALVWVDSEVSDNRFAIAGKRDIKVSWTIKVLRNDPGCLEDLRRRPVEQMKNELQ